MWISLFAPSRPFYSHRPFLSSNPEDSLLSIPTMLYIIHQSLQISFTFIIFLICFCLFISSIFQWQNNALDVTMVTKSGKGNWTLGFRYWEDGFCLCPFLRSKSHQIVSTFYWRFQKKVKVWRKRLASRFSKLTCLPLCGIRPTCYLSTSLRLWTCKPNIQNMTTKQSERTGMKAELQAADCSM